MDRQSRLKSVFETIAGLFGFVVLIAISIGAVLLFLKGATFMAQNLLPALINISSTVFWVFLLIVLPISFIRGARGVMAIVALLCSYIFGITGWLIGFVLTYTYWGVFWVIFGMFLGVGVVPFGLLASSLNNNWGSFLSLAFALVMTYGLRFYSVWLSVKYDEYYDSKNTYSDDIIEGEEIDSGVLSLDGQKMINQSNFSIDEDSSILLVGQTGTGKTELVKSLLKKLKKNYSPKEVSFVIFDMKQVEFQDEDKQYLLKDIVTESTEGLRVLKDLVVLANKRIKDKVEYPAIVLYIEECDIAAQYQDKFDELFISLIDKSKLANFCVIYSTSRVDSGTISYELLKHFEVLMVSRLSSGSTSYLGVDDTSDISGYNFRKIDNKSINRHTHPTSTDSIDTLVEKAKKLFKKEGRASSALIQRELHVGYPVAVKVMDKLEDMGLIGPADGAKPRRVINDFTKTKKPVHKIGNDELVDWDTIK